MAKERLDQKTTITPANADVVAVSGPSNSPLYKALVWVLVKAGLTQPNSASAGAGADLPIKTADGVTAGKGGDLVVTLGNGAAAGAGGSFVVYLGAQGSSGGNGVGKWVNPTTTTSYTYTDGLGNYIAAASMTTRGFAMSSGMGAIRAVTSAGAFCPLAANFFFVTSGSGSTGISMGYGAKGVITVDLCNPSGDTFTPSNAGSCFATPPGNAYALSTATNDLANPTFSEFFQINCTVASNVTGIAPASGSTFQSGQRIEVYNTGTANITLIHNSASSAAANRMFMSTGANIVLTPNQSVWMRYDTTNNGSGAAGWRVKSAT